MRIGLGLGAVAASLVLLALWVAPARTAEPTGDVSVDRSLMSGMADMHRDMSAARLNGDPDHDFVAMMMPHHRGAIDMARVELRDGRDPELRKLARDIVAAQERELHEMADWRTRHGGGS